MSIRYVLGLPGSGKTELVLNEIVNKINEGTNKSLIYIVPEQYSLQSERNIVGRVSEKSVTRVQVLSFQRLAFYLFSETGAAPGKFMDDIGKSLLIKRLITEMSGELVFFGKASDKQGFTESLSGLITELYRYNVTADAFKSKMDFMAETDTTRAKLTELYTLYKGYCDYMTGKYISADETLDLLARKIKDSRYLKDAEVWIDGFHSFTPQELRVISVMMGYAGRITITATVNEKSISYGSLKQVDFFYEIKNSINKITKLADDMGAVLEEPVFLDGTLKRYMHFPEMDYLARNYFRHKTSGYKPLLDMPAHSRIKIIAAPDKYGELDAAAAEILRLVRDRGYRYRDIAVLTGSPDRYKDCAADVFRQYGIPFFIDVKTDILAHPLTELIRAAVDITVHNFSYEGVFRFLKTRLTGIDPAKIDILENYVLAYGIKGYKWEMDAWRYGFNDGVYDKEEIHELKTLIIGILKPFGGSLRYDSVLTVRDLSVRMFDMLYRMNIPETLNGWVSDMNAAGELEAARQHSQIWSKICSVFDKMVEILGDERVTVKEYGRILDAGLSAMDMGIIPPSIEQIIIGDISLSRLPEVKALFIVGANEGLLPRAFEDTGILNDSDRAALAVMGLELSPDSKRKAMEEQFLIYCGICRPSEFMMMSWCAGDMDGKALRRSVIIDRLMRMFPHVREEKASHCVTLPKPELARLGPVVSYYLVGGDISAQDKDILGWFLGNDQYAGILHKMETARGGMYKEERLGRSSLKKLYKDEIITSVSRLERYAQCPFSYFMEYTLIAKEREIYQIKPLDMGTLFHQVLEDFTLALADEGLSWRDAEKDKIDELVGEAVDRLGEKTGGEVFLSSARYKYMLRKVKRIAARSVWALTEHIKSGSFEPYMSELEFAGGGPLTGISIRINDRQRFILTGKIDRVDILDVNGSKYVKIIDYKSGATKFDPTDVYFGTQLQLVLYLDAFIKNGKAVFGAENVQIEILPGGIFYFNINDPMLDYNGEPTDEELEEMMLEAFRMSGLAINDPDVILGMDSGLAKSSLIIPVKLDKSGEITGKGAVDAGVFEKLRESVLEKIREIGLEMVDGNIGAFPYKKGMATGCDYCEYGAVCGFGETEAPKRYNIVKKANIGEVTHGS